MTNIERDPPSSIRHPRSVAFDHPLWLAMLLTALVVLPRSLSIARAHSESWDDQYHLVRGLAQWRGNHLRIEYNDPPFGEMILATPMWIAGCSLEATQRDPTVIAHGADPLQCILYGQPVSPETLLMLIAGWKALLFGAGAGVVFVWCRRLYGLGAAWLALVALLAEPTIAAHTAVASLDTLAWEAALVACYLIWRQLESPHWGRLIGGCAAIAAALTIKQTTVFVLPVFVVFCILRWSAQARKFLALSLFLVPLFIWAFTLFDISRPSERAPVMSANYTEHWSFAGDVINANLSRRWPAGIYIASIVNGIAHASEGHPSYLLGETRRGGWWYYQLVAAVVKMPVGIAVLLVVGLISAWLRRPRFEELSLIVPFAMAFLLVLATNISIGFRHSIPWYVFAIMLASRCMTVQPSWMRIVAWCGVIATAIQGMFWHPDELSFVNVPWKHPASIVSDSNIDWGQSLKQIRQWLDAHPQDRPVYAQLFIPDTHGVAYDHYLDGRVTWLNDGLPEHGVVILSPVMMWGAYAPAERFEKLREKEPIAVIGHCIRVYDVDAK